MAAASSPGYTIPALTQLSTAIASVATPQFHPILLPISPLTLIHAVRVSYGVTQVQGGTRRPLVQSVALVWILLFGGWSILRVALAQTSPLLERDVQWTALVYGGIHALCQLTGVASLLIRAGKMPGVGLAMDLFFDIVDGVCRMEGIAALGVEPLRDHPSALTPLLTSVLIGGGGPLLIGLFNLTSSNWSLQTPTWLSQPTDLLVIDIWSSALVGWLYLTLSSGDLAAKASLPRGLLAPTAAGDDARPLLSRGEAQLFGTVVLATLLAANRLRVHLASSGAAKSKSSQQKQQQRGKKGGGAVKKNKEAASTRSLLVYLGLALPLSLIGLQYLLAGDSFGVNGLQPPRLALLLLAHPDDEVMFFSPILHSLLSAQPRPQIVALSLSVGQAPKGAAWPKDVRARELRRAYEILGVVPPLQEGEGEGGDGGGEGRGKGNTVLAIDAEGLQDGMTNEWEAERVVQVVLEKLTEVGVLTPGGVADADQPTAGTETGTEAEAATGPDWILTFDNGGVSGHANHRALARAGPLLAERLAGGAYSVRGHGRALRPQVYANPTLPLALKYGSLPYALAARIWALLKPVPLRLPPSSSSTPDGTCLTALSSPGEYLTSLRAMRHGHASQMEWFRWGWWVLSSYVFGGRVCPVSAAAGS